MSENDEITVNLDTSVLLNYVFSNLPGELEREKGSHRIIDEEAIETVIAGKAKGEFVALCDRRQALYEDIVDVLLKTDKSIFEYDPYDRDVYTSENDKGHLRDKIQMNWHDRPKREQLDILRRCLQELGLYRTQLPHELIDKQFPAQQNDELLERFRSELDIGHDCEILVDAVELSREYAVETLVAVDSDLTDEENVACACAIVEDVLGLVDVLNVVEPNDV